MSSGVRCVHAREEREKPAQRTTAASPQFSWSLCLSFSQIIANSIVR